MATLLTTTAVKRMKHHSQRIEVRDAGCRGLIFVIQPSGHKSWAMRFRDRNGKLVRMALGAVDLTGQESAAEPIVGSALTLVAARRIAAEINRQRAFGCDVVAARRRDELERKVRGSKTFDQAAVDFVEQHVRPKTRRWQSQARLLGVRPKAEEGLELIPDGLADRWRAKQVAEIDGDDIFAIVDEARHKGVPGLERRNKKPSDPRARTMFAILSKMFSWLVQKRRAKQNPCGGVHKPDAPKARDRVLTDAEIVKFWSACDKAYGPFGQALKLLLLTGCRLNEVAGMRRSELSDDGQTWTIPGHRTKNHRTHVVPLSKLTQELLQEVATDGEIVFTTNGTTPVSGWSKTKKRLDEAMLAQGDHRKSDANRNSDEVKLPPWRLHDLRRTCATGMAEIGIAPHIVEACLNHVSGAKAGVAGTYNRAAYASEKKIALDRWAAHILGLTSRRQAEVVPLHGAGG
ncbi:tyrosine-type recombinase/integrase [Bradyrhizobium lupini]|uniref:tyrosine-type recombinase/integrase n=1 Tax=Rhizobium lupini TaxID=136996 RepID=UPI00366CE5B0